MVLAATRMHKWIEKQQEYIERSEKELLAAIEVQEQSIHDVLEEINRLTALEKAEMEAYDTQIRRMESAEQTESAAKRRHIVDQPVGFTIKEMSRRKREKFKIKCITLGITMTDAVLKLMDMLVNDEIHFDEDELEQMQELHRTAMLQ